MQMSWLIILALPQRLGIFLFEKMLCDAATAAKPIENFKSWKAYLAAVRCSGVWYFLIFQKLVQG
ncbi:MAG TPA: hypothetical protein DEF72_07975 [Gammaproteobacteria bacterium]|nr:hypothetical protein [Gammaproteobacteria bacterium]